MKRHAPATLRNRDAIGDVLAKELPDTGKVLEIASGSGEHAVAFSGRFPNLVWQPSDPDPEAIRSIAAWREDAGLQNLAEPIAIDAGKVDWPIEQVDAIVCINMAHISPWSSTEGLFAGAAHLLSPDAPLLIYGPYKEPNVPLAPSNADFDASLRARDPRWGLRNTADVDRLATASGFRRSARVAMPANNIALVYR